MLANSASFHASSSRDEGRVHVFAEGLDHLHHQLAAARDAADVGLRASARRPSARPGWHGAAPRASAPMLGAPPKPAMRSSVAVELLPCQIDLQRRADEQVAGIVAGRLAEGAVRAHRPVRPGEEHIGARGDVILHAELGTERVDRLRRNRPRSPGSSSDAGFSAQWLQILPFSPRLAA